MVASRCVLSVMTWRWCVSGVMTWRWCVSDMMTSRCCVSDMMTSRCCVHCTMAHTGYMLILSPLVKSWRLPVYVTASSGMNGLYFLLQFCYILFLFCSHAPPPPPPTHTHTHTLPAFSPLPPPPPHLSFIHLATCLCWHLSLCICMSTYQLRNSDLPSQSASPFIASNQRNEMKLTDPNWSRTRRCCCKLKCADTGFMWSLKVFERLGKMGYAFQGLESLWKLSGVCESLWILWDSEH